MLEKSFAHQEAERRLYETWEREGRFAARPDSGAEPFTIMIPPPNVTGNLHVGHALTFTLQDLLVRWRRMQGRDVLWQPGTDHAGIATQMVVERDLALEQTSRQKLGREEFLRRVWKWKAESGGSITQQLRRLGASLDWPRERFTMDEGLSRAVRRVFVSLYREKLIYRDRRLVNWDPKLQTAISDLEVESRESNGHLWHINYAVQGEDGRFITVATTRPETMLGDTAVAVHPEDERYRGLIGKFMVLPLVGRVIPVVADEHSDPTKGTGAVKITPAHDFNDFEVGKRHGLPMPSILDRSGHVTLAEIETEIRDESGFVRTLDGMERGKAREAILAELERLELLVKAEPHKNMVPYGDRSGVVIEPLLTTQWFCDAATLAEPAVQAVREGRTNFVPKQWENTFFAWMREIEPWCISRQLWWGHRIPAWYGPDGSVYVAEDEAEARAQADEKFGSGVALEQDADVLDTWFSSALWPFSTLGWPEKTPEVARYYPGSVLVTGFDIIFFWVARMMMMGLHFMDDVPFREVYIHGLVRDERGQKMSKSKGNVIDPLGLIDYFGTDALRFTIASLAGPGRDIKLGPSRVESYRSFVTKLWNAARFAEMNGIVPKAGFKPAQARSVLARWILAEASSVIEEATKALEAYRFDEYAAACYRFTWKMFCDWFLELTKLARPEETEEIKDTAAYVLGLILRLLHPVMPFVTEELWGEFGYGEKGTLIVAPWPSQLEVTGADAARAELGWLTRFIGEIRTVRAEMNVPPSQPGPVLLRDAPETTLERVARWSDAIKRLARVSDIGEATNDIPAQSAQLVVDEATIILPLAELIDLAAERLRLNRECEKSAAEAAKIRKRLENADFVARAKPEVVEENRERLANFESDQQRLQAALQRIA